MEEFTKELISVQSSVLSIGFCIVLIESQLDFTPQGQARTPRFSQTQQGMYGCTLMGNPAL